MNDMRAPHSSRNKGKVWKLELEKAAFLSFKILQIRLSLPPLTLLFLTLSPDQVLLSTQERTINKIC